MQASSQKNAPGKQRFTEQTPVLCANAVSKQFLRDGHGTNVLSAVKEASLKLLPGQFVVLNGRSGSGKTTLLHMLAGLLEPTTGQVTVRVREDASPDPDPVDLYALSDEARSSLRGRHFGIIPQNAGAVGTLTVYENILLPYTLNGITAPNASVLKEDSQLAFRLGIAALLNEYPAALSGGELRRMAIARALIRKPDIIFADEPTGDLDEENTNLVFTLMREAADNGTAVLMATHEPAAAAYADLLFRMDGGVLCPEAP